MYKESRLILATQGIAEAASVSTVSFSRHHPIRLGLRMDISFYGEDLIDFLHHLELHLEEGRRAVVGVEKGLYVDLRMPPWFLKEEVCDELQKLGCVNLVKAPFTLYITESVLLPPQAKL